MKPYKPVMLMILDGWGLGDGTLPEFDATQVAATPNMDKLKKQYPYTTLSASGEDVGLPAGQMGNSEVGHLNIGAGRIVYQDLTRIDRAIREGSFQTNPVLNQACQKAQAEGRPLHLLGLLSAGGVHSQLTHLYALLEMAKDHDLNQVYIHVLLDGRDTPPQSGLGYVRQLEEKLKQLGVGRIATVIGRYFTMDRDKRWDRVEKGYQVLVTGAGYRAADGVAAVKAAYDRGETDEFVAPTAIWDAAGPIGLVQNGDPLILYNFRTDRLRELCHVFTDEVFPHFSQQPAVRPWLVTMTQYEAGLPVAVAFAPQDLDDTLGQVVAARGLRQLRIAETEKYAHVTFFFNGGLDTPNPGEDRILIPSPKVATYDLQPVMSTPQVGARVNEEIRRHIYDLIILNYANPDMVGHTGSLPAAIAAVATVDEWVGKNVAEILDQGGAVIITADHGNVETMWDPATQGPCTAHTCNQVPCIVVGRSLEGCALRQGGRLADLAPTLLALLGLDQPKAMTGRSLLLPENRSTIQNADAERE